jgi:hypothetical protein
VEHFFSLFMLVFYGLLLACLLFAELAGRASTKTGILLRGEWGRRALCRVYAERWAFAAFLPCVVMVDMAARIQAPYALLFVVWLACVCGMSVAAAIWVWRWVRSGEPLRVSQGALFGGVEALRRKTAAGATLQVYVLPDGYIRRPQDTSDSNRVVVPRRLLDLLSRGEVDALVAFQLVRLPRAGRVFVGALAYALAAAVVIAALKIGASRQLGVFLALLALELLALTILWPRLESHLDRHAIEVAGDPDVYLSALVKLYRLSGSSPDQRYLSRIARTAGVPPERLQALLQEELLPAEDRYPTSGDYMTVGF